MQEMIGKMAKMYPMLLMVGFVIVVIAFVIGLGNSSDASDYYSADKLTRETTSEFIALRSDIESTDLWMPPFKFLGIGFILGGIVMALRVIIDELRNAGKKVLPVDRHASLPTPPWFGLMMPMVMMVGMAFFVIALIVGIDAAGTARDVFANDAPTIDAAAQGSQLLDDLSYIHEVRGWMVPLKFLAIATEFLAITMGLATIIYILDRQTEIIDDALNTEKAKA